MTNEHEPSSSEEDFTRRFLAGDAEVFAELMELNRGRLFMVACRMVGNYHDAEDVLQNAWLSAVQDRDSFEGKSKIGTWLYKIVVNEALMHLRSKRGRGKKANGNVLSLERDSVEIGKKGDIPLKDDLQSGQTTPLQALLEWEAEEETRSAIASLTESERLVIELRRDGLSNREIADRIGKSEGAVKTQVSRAKKAFRSSLEFVLEN